MTLNTRSQNVLAAVVREYILHGEPVGSRSLVKQYRLLHSPATVRNVMSDLEEEGFLHQPHTSAGRMPTDLGLRLYVDKLMQIRELNAADQQELMSRYQLTNLEVQDLLRECSRLLSDLSSQCAVVLVPRVESAVLKRLEFVQIREGKLIAVLVLSSGVVQNRMLDLSEPLLPHELETIHSYLNDLCVGQELRDVRRLVQQELDNEQNQYDDLVSQALNLGSQALVEPADDVVIEGQSRLLDHPKGFDPEEMKNVLRAVEQKRLVLRLLDDTIQAEGVQVFIGQETQEVEMRSCAVVATAYGGEQPLGTLGVIGPSNMDYPRVVPLVDFTAGLLTTLLGEH